MSLAQGNNTPTRPRIEPGSPDPESDAQEHFCQRLLFISPAKKEIYAKQLLYPLKFTHKNGGNFLKKGHFYRHASSDQNVNIPLMINFNRSVMFLRLFIYAYLCTMFNFCVGI